MAEKSAISWTRSTFNPWIGCTRVGPGCDHCYAAVSTPARSQGIVWGPGQPRKRTVPSNWAKPLQWEKLAAEERRTGVLAKGHEGWARPGFWPVFCASLADVFDNEVPQGWREDLWDLIEATPNLTWLVVTKRIGNVRSMLPGRWMEDELNTALPPNIRIISTIVNAWEAHRDIPKLLSLGCKNGISYEPGLGDVNWYPWFQSNGHLPEDSDGAPFRHGLQWIIVGGESDQAGMKARPFNVNWARSTVQQCREAGVPVFVKQLGSAAISDFKPRTTQAVLSGDQTHWKYLLADRAGADPSEWPEDLRVQEFPV